MKKRIVLFDMDGTLTAARKKISPQMIKLILKLSQTFEIGIVSGSQYSYIEEQLYKLIYHKDLNKKIFHILPCNGTQRYVYSKKEWRLSSEVNMENYLTEKKFRPIMMALIKLLDHYSKKRGILPLTGNFIVNRGSMVNFCLIGRNSNDAQRKKFADLDEEYLIRDECVKFLKTQFKFYDIECDAVLGGSTSIDIFPAGWDKTYALKYFPNHQKYFVGDKVGRGGNDHTIFKALYPNAYSTASLKETKKIIKEFSKNGFYVKF